jgi:hypothetical protein
MDMAADMELWLDSVDGFNQLLATKVLIPATIYRVENPVGGSVRNQDVGIALDAVPMLLDLGAAMAVKGPIKEERLDWRPIYP